MVEFLHEFARLAAFHLEGPGNRAHSVLALYKPRSLAEGDQTDMSPKKVQANLFRLALLPLTAIVLVASGCSSGGNNSTTLSNGGGPVFVVGTDAPASIPDIVGVPIQITGIYLTNTSTSTTSGNLLASSTTVDFARYNGLQGFIDMNNVQPGYYTGVTIDLGTGSINYLDMTTTPPTVPNEAATLPSSVNVSLPNTLTVSQTGGVPVGLRIDMDLGQSIVTSGGVPTGTINPVFDVRAVARTDTWAHIDEFVGSVTTEPSSATATSFGITGPHGENFTINISSTTEWDGGATESELIADGSNAIVEVAGQFDPADQTLDADEIAIVSDTGFTAGGLVTYVTPTAPSVATAMQFYVDHVLPSGNSNVQLGNVANVSITGNEKYSIYWMHNAFTNALFNDAAMTPGQRIRVGGADPTTSPFDVKRIHLENRGYNGTVVAGSENPGQLTFQMNVTGFAGVVISSPITVYLGSDCDFRYGFGAFSNITDNAQIRVVGLLLNLNGQDVLVARHIDGTNFTDATVTAQ